MRDAIGLRGEAIFSVLITKLHPTHGPLFRPQFLGDKWPLIDYIVELVGTSAYFFVQVKATRKGYTKQKGRLKVQVKKAEVQGLAKYPAPTYIVGIDEEKERGFVASANGETMNRMNNISTNFALNDSNLLILWNEVDAFWKSYPNTTLTSSFVDTDWR